jgi:TRAP transporter TAXI family solute receptor
MKKRLTGLTALILVLVMVFSACGSGTSTPTNAPATDAPADNTGAPDANTPDTDDSTGMELTGNYDLIIATGGTGGTYYPYGGALAQLFSQIDGVAATATSTGASAENARLLNNNEADLAILQNDVMDYAYNGTETMAEGGALKNIATIATLYPEVIQIVVTVESGINSIEDMAGKRISVGAAGSGTEANARQIFEAYGMTYDDFDESFLGFAESSTGMQNKTLDGAFIVAGIPNSSIMELAAMTPVKLITLDADKIQALIDKYGFYSSYEIPDEAYENIEGGCTTVSILATLACSADLDDALVYNLTKTLFESQAELAQANEKAKELDIEKAVVGVSVPFHPGAEQYYKEQGILD